MVFLQCRGIGPFLFQMFCCTWQSRRSQVYLRRIDTTETSLCRAEHRHVARAPKLVAWSGQERGWITEGFVAGCEGFVGEIVQKFSRNL